MMATYRTVLVFALSLFGVVPSASALDVVATTGMVGDVVKAVAGARVDVRVLMGEGVDPHLYRARASDVRAIMRADAVFYNGLFLEGRMAEVLEQAAKRGKEVVAVGEVVSEDIRLGLVIDGEAHTDPHVWMDTRLWTITIEPITATLIRIDPAGKASYLANAAAFKKQLIDVDVYIREVLATVPVTQRVLITAHDAFGYFGRAYNVSVAGIQGISTESEAGLADIIRLVNYIVEHKIPAVFVESSVPEKNVRALIEGAESQGHVVRIGGELFSDAMGEPGTWEGTYIGMVDHNATTITNALGGTAPKGGFRAWKAAKETNPTP
jgi:manganese/zinc/iron transport system substrate-binding protein